MARSLNDKGRDAGAVRGWLGSRGLVAALVIAAVLTGACSQAPAGPAATSAPAAAATAPALAGNAAPTAAGSTKMVISYSNLIGTEIPLWYAAEKGIFTKNGLDVEVTLIESTKGIPALLAGQTTAADIGGSEALSAASQGGDLIVVSITGPVYPYVFMVPSDITKPEQLKGKKVAVSSLGGSADIATRVGLRGIGLDPEKDVDIIATGSLQNRTAAMLSGQVQGGVGQPPDTVALAAKGFHPLFDMAAMKQPAAITSAVFQRSYLAAHKAEVQKFVDSIVEATAQLKKDKPGTIAVLKKYYKSDDEAAMGETFDYFAAEVLPALPYPRPEMLGDAVKELSKKNEKIASFDLSKLLDPSFVQNAADRKVGGS